MGASLCTTHDEDRISHDGSESEEDDGGNGGGLWSRWGAMLGLGGPEFKTSRAIRVGSSRGSVQGHSALIVCNDSKKLEDYFDMDGGDPIGTGGYAEVRRGRNRLTHALRAIKCISKARVKEAWRLQEECDIMLSMDHPHIVKIYQTFEDSA